MKVWKLRTCKIAPFVTGAALFGYTCAVITKHDLVAPQSNSIIVGWLVLANVAALGTLGLALLRDDIDELRALVARSQRNPRLRFLAPAVPRPSWEQNTAPYGHVYGHSRPVLDTDRTPSLEEQIRGLDPPTDDIRKMAS